MTKKKKIVLPQLTPSKDDTTPTTTSENKYSIKIKVTDCCECLFFSDLRQTKLLCLQFLYTPYLFVCVGNIFTIFKII
jgi:hypothetical protein